MRGNFELEFTLNAAFSSFSHPGGGLIVRLVAVGTFSTSTVCPAVLLYWAATDPSGYFVERFHGDTSGTVRTIN